MALFLGDRTHCAKQQRAIIGTGFFIVALLFTALLHHLWLGRSSLTPIATWLVSWNAVGVDSWEPMRRAYYFWQENPSAPLYQRVFFDAKIKFQYPPSSLLIFYFGDLFGRPPSNRILNFASRVAIAVQLCAVAAFATGLALRHRPAAPKGFLFVSLIAVSICSTITFYPMLQSYYLGQIQTWLNASFVLACLMFLVDRRFAAGLFVGAICLVKPHFSLFILWALLRRQWQFIFGWCLIAVPFGLASLAIFGLTNHFDYLSVLSHLSRHGEAYSPNQSFNGLINRMTGNGESLTFQLNEFPPYNIFVHVATFATSLILISFALFFRWKDSNISSMDFLIMGLTLTVASPIAWEHHYGILPPVFVLLWISWVLNPHGCDVLKGLLLAIAFAFASVWWLSFDLLANTWLNILQSYLYLSALILLWLLCSERDGFAATEMSSKRPLMTQNEIIG